MCACVALVLAAVVACQTGSRATGAEDGGASAEGVVPPLDGAGRGTARGDAGQQKTGQGGTDDAGTGATSDRDATLAGNAAGAQAADAGAPPATLTAIQTLIPDPSWTCGMPNGIAPPQSGQLVFAADLTLGVVHDVGETQYGHRTLIEIKGGTVSGPKIKGQFMNFGLDWQLALSNGAIEDEQVDVIQTDDGTPVYFRDCGTSPGPASEVRIVPDFEAPSGGNYAWLNSGEFVGTREFDAAGKTLKLTVYDVSGVALPADSVRVTDPAGVPNQTWDCKVAAGTKTTTVYTESVGIGSSVSVGASKRGTRNIVPITGGTTSGKLQGSVLAGGADFQLSASAFELDARYTVQTGDGELIVVRNCGPLGALVPVFETRTDGGYAWVNANRWLSSDPGVGVGVVNLTIYDTQ
jgi:Protein of unknown function (DUF3237)